MTEQIDYFRQELSQLRNAVEGFSRAYPSAASELHLSAGHSSDPHVEQLLQSFAWLTSQLRNDLHQQRQEIPNHLQLSLYPYLMNSIPSMTVLQANVLADGANFVNGYTLEKGRLFSTWSVEQRGGDKKDKRPVECRMQCCYDTPLWPLHLEEVSIKPKNVFEFLDNKKDVNGVISIKLSSFGTDPVYEYPMDNLRFFIADPDVRANLYQLLSSELYSIAIKKGDDVVELDNSSIQWLGFDEKHNMLPQMPGTHQSYRLLLEYFYFPEKFYFFEVCGLDLGHITEDFEILLVLKDINKRLSLNEKSLQINSFPAINLFPASFKPIQLDHSRYEYRVIADETQYGQSEVYSISQVKVMSSDGSVREAEPWLGSGEEFKESDDNRVFDTSELSFVTRLVSPLSPTCQGSDTMVSLYDESLSPAQPVDQTLSSKGLCNNRQLPESLRIGNAMKLVGAGAMVDATIISRPTLFKGAKLDGESTIKLISQLHLNQLALVNTESPAIVLQRLKKLLQLYCDPLTRSHQRQIDGIMGMQTKSSVRRMGKEAWRGHYRGSLVTLTIDESYFEGVNPLLFGEVLSHFLGMYTTLNHFVQLQFMSYKREGVWKQWPPRIGEQIIL